MEPRIVEEAPMPPGQCLFSQDQEGPWIDTGVKAPWVSPYGYISVKYVESLARDLLGMVSARDVETKVNELEDRLAAYGAQIEQLTAFAQASKLADELKEGAGI